MRAFLEILTDTGSLTAAVANATAYYTNAKFAAPFTAADTCDLADGLVAVTPQGLAYTRRSLGYDYTMFSYVGCRCASGYTHIYTLDPATGNAQKALLLTLILVVLTSVYTRREVESCTQVGGLNLSDLLCLHLQCEQTNKVAQSASLYIVLYPYPHSRSNDGSWTRDSSRDDHAHWYILTQMTGSAHKQVSLFCCKSCVPILYHSKCR